MSAWQRLSIVVASDRAEAVSEALEARGALAVTLLDAADEPIYEPLPGTMPVWQATRVEGLFEGGSDWEAIAAALSAELGLLDARWHCEPLADRAWERVWMDRFKPMRFGRRLWICPTAYPVPDDAEVALRLDPGLAFGTGSHPTTALCLEALDGMPLAGLDVIDYGCGSGVLAIAALLLGARRVQGIDIDRQALTASRANAVANAVSERLLLTGRSDALQPADAVLANILAGPLVALAPRLAALARPRARLVLSGILASQADQVRAAYAGDFELEPPRQREDWVCLCGVRRH